MTIGICKLTLKQGTYIKSHLIPLAFTKPTVGQYFIEGAPGLRPTRRHTSWYDPQLVTRKGEDILAHIDSNAVNELRRLKLVWSGWSDLESTYSGSDNVQGESYGIRSITNASGLLLHKFFVSLVWRAAASERPEYAHVKVNDQSLEVARLILNSKADLTENFWPVQLVQLTSRGEHHNLGPIETQFDWGEHNISGYRFYMDGLIAKVFTECSPGAFQDVRKTFLLHDEEFIATSHTYENSFQRLNMDRHKEQSFRDFPEQMKRLTR